MSKADILAELPKLTPEELTEIQSRIDDLATYGPDGWRADCDLTEAEKQLIEARLDDLDQHPEKISPLGGSGSAPEGPLRQVTYQLAIHPGALADIEAAGKWYEERQPGLGADFSDTVRQAINTLAANPLIYCLRERRRQVRWFFPPRFPYRIVYRVNRELITIVAVIHAARHDRHWRQRL